ncbi:hypothetical protein Tco_0632934 [Tanacetum coccineum]
MAVGLGEADSELFAKNESHEECSFKDWLLEWGNVYPLMHTIMVPEQVKTMKIQAGVQVSRQGELKRHLELWKCFGRYCSQFFRCLSW